MDVSWVFSRITQPGNLGFCARLMHNFGYQDMRLVDCCNHLDNEAVMFSAGSHHILHEAKSYSNLKEALSDRRFVIGTSARKRAKLAKLKSIADISSQAINQKSAFLFGNEASGLNNFELEYCSELYFIPTAGEKSSLNIAHATAIVMYQLQQKNDNCKTEEVNKLAEAGQLADFRVSVYDLLDRIGFVKFPQKSNLIKTIAAITNRMSLTERELIMAKAIIGRTSSYIDRLSAKNN